MTEQRTQGDYAEGWSKVDKIVGMVALALNNSDDSPMSFNHSNKASQEQLLMRAEVLINELKNMGVIVLHPKDQALQERLANFVMSILDPEPPSGTN